MGKAAGASPDRSSQRRRTEATILDAAVRVLAANRQASLADIAREAGVGRATLHRYFADRDAMVRAIADEALTATRSALTRARPATGDPLEALLRVVEGLLAMGARYAFLVMESAIVEDAEFIAADRAAMAPVRQLIIRGQKSGALRSDLPADWVFDALEALVYTGWIAIEREGVGVGEAARRVMKTVEGGFTGARRGGAEPAVA